MPVACMREARSAPGGGRVSIKRGDGAVAWAMGRSRRRREVLEARDTSVCPAPPRAADKRCDAKGLTKHRGRGGGPEADAGKVLVHVEVRAAAHESGRAAPPPAAKLRFRPPKRKPAPPPRCPDPPGGPAAVAPFGHPALPDAAQPQASPSPPPSPPIFARPSLDAGRCSRPAIAA